MQKWRPRSLSHSLSATRIQPLSLTDFMDVHCLTFSLIEYTPHSCLVFIFFPFLPSFLSPFPLCRLLSGISSRLTSLAVTLDFKELLHSSVTHQRERAIQRCAKREGGDEEWVYKKKKKKGWTSVWKEGSREKEDPLLTAGNLRSHKSKGGTHSHTSTHPYRVTLSTYTHFFFFCSVGCVQIPHTWSFLFSVYPSSVYLIFLSFLSLEPAVQRGCRGLFLPVIPHCTWVCVCVCFSILPTLWSFSHISKSRPLYFHHLRAHWHSPSFFHPSMFWSGWRASFQVTGNCYCFPSQLETGSHSTAHKHKRTQICTLFCFVHHSLFVSGLYRHVAVWSCIYGCPTCKDAYLVGVPGNFSSVFCFFIIPSFICFSPLSNKS